MMRSEIAGFRAPVYLLGDRGKQEYQRVSPDCPGANGRKPSLRPCREDDSGPDGSGRISIASYAFDSRPRPRLASGSASTTPDRPPFPHIAEAEAEAPAAAASPNRAARPLDVVGAGSGLLQWGHNKRSRGSRAAADESSSGGHARQVIKIQRRSSAAAEKAAAEKAAMPPPGASYTRGANLRPCTPVRDATSPLLSRSVEERSGGHKRSPPKAGTAAAAPALESGSKPSSELETGSSSGAAAAAPEKLNLDRFEWPRIYLSLSRKEKEDDFLAMKGTKLPQRPKKRAKNVEKALQYCFPGMWLSDLTRGRYEVREKKCVKKKRRGLKGMESMDSDSD